MWEAIKALAELGALVVGLIRRPTSQPQDNHEVPPTQRSIAIAQESGHAASREGKIAAKKAE